MTFDYTLIGISTILFYWISILFIEYRLQLRIRRPERVPISGIEWATII